MAANVPVLFVEHDIDRVLGFSHAVTVMNEGAVLMTGAPEAVRADCRVQAVYTDTGPPVVTGRAAAGSAAAATVLTPEGLDPTSEARPVGAGGVSTGSLGC